MQLGLASDHRPIWLLFGPLFAIFMFFKPFFVTTTQTNKPTNPQTDGYKKPGPAECALALWIRRPLWGTKRARPESRTDRLQSLSRVRTLCRASPKVSPFLLRSLNFQNFSDFRSIFFCFKKTLNFGSAQNYQKSQKSDLGAFLAPMLVAFWTPFGNNFLNISRFPENLYFCNTSPAKPSF